VKFLRRRRQIAEDPLFADLDPAFLEGPDAGGAGGPSESAIVDSVLRKMDILQGRDRKFRFIGSIARLPRAWVPRVFIELLSDGSEEIREAAVRELAEREDCPIERLHSRLKQPPWYVKSSILRILATKRRPESVRHIREVIDDPNVDVKRSAALALGEIGGQEARTLLVRLTRDVNPYVRSAAVEALEKAVEIKFS
jgi:HEAT repeat protein